MISTISITERIMLMDSLKACYVEKMLLLLLLEGVLKFIKF